MYWVFVFKSVYRCWIVNDWFSNGLLNAEELNGFSVSWAVLRLGWDW